MEFVLTYQTQYFVFHIPYLNDEDTIDYLEGIIRNMEIQIDLLQARRI